MLRRRVGRRVRLEAHLRRRACGSVLRVRRLASCPLLSSGLGGSVRRAVGPVSRHAHRRRLDGAHRDAPSRPRHPPRACGSGSGWSAPRARAGWRRRLRVAHGAHGEARRVGRQPLLLFLRPRQRRRPALHQLLLLLPLGDDELVGRHPSVDEAEVERKELQDGEPRDKGEQAREREQQHVRHDREAGVGIGETGRVGMSLLHSSLHRRGHLQRGERR
mmetsp:Transcript_30186/g.51576  ORF Transcript_30186/g.51576 Transcript_30186/m.51576 type:complete len:218 (-) Transcript_30186:9-662(-)